MRFLTRSAALAFGLTLAGGLTFGGPEARAQVPTVPYRGPIARPVVPNAAYVPYARGIVPNAGYQHINGYFRPTRTGAAYTRHYGYESARRDSKLYKPWLDR